METIERRRDGDTLQPAQVRLEWAAIALLIERIAKLDKEERDDLVAVMMDIRNCNNEDELKEVEETVRELLFPELAGKLVVEWESDSRAAAQLESWTKKIGARIRELREEKHWTQERLAGASGLTQSHISRLEKGQHSPSHKTVSAIATALGVSVADIDPSCPFGDK